MNDSAGGYSPYMLWLIGGAALLWNILGLWIFVSTVSATPDELAMVYNESEARFITSIPIWATAANGLAVITGVLGCVLLLLRRALAAPVFIVSFVALLVQDLHSFVLNDVTAIFGMVPAYIQGTVLAVAIAMILYSRSLVSKGVLR